VHVPRLAALLIFLAAPAAAQTVTGTVRSADDGQPVGGVLVVLTDEAEVRTGGAITGADGTYRIVIGTPGRYRLVAERIGYATTRSAWFEAAAGRALRMDISASVEATTLDGVTASVERRCVLRPEEGTITQRLWDEARKALTAAEVTREHSLVRWRALDYSRSIDPVTRRVLADSTSVRLGGGDRPYVSAPVERLVSDGFVRTRGDTTTYYAPDAAVLLSDEFLETHCFGATASADGRIGLTFEPVPGRRVTDVSGTLWMDAATLELQTLEFGFTWLPIRASGERFGGIVEFQRLDTGSWITRRWELRLPQTQVDRDEWWGCNGNATVCWRAGLEISLELAAIREDGGRVMETVGRSSMPNSTRTATLEGIVLDSSGRPLAAAEVYLSGTAHRARSDSEGRYRMPGLPPGEYTIGFLRPALDPSGPVAPPVRVLLMRGESTTVNLTAPRGSGGR
jgi:hypothetical protein